MKKRKLRSIVNRHIGDRMVSNAATFDTTHAERVKYFRNFPQIPINYMNLPIG